VRAKRYYTLWASLPALPDFTTAERLPINRQRLDSRLNMLDEPDHEQLYVAAPLLAWDREAVARVDQQLARDYEAIRPTLVNEVLRHFVDGQLENRTILAALRRRQLGQQTPPDRNRWGVGPRVRWLAEHWDAPHFALEKPLPWLPEARACLESGDAIGLQRLMLGLAWRGLGQIIETHPFRFEAVFAYAFRWGILNRWLAYDADAAIERFRELVTEGIGDYELSFA
jgi:hypothetical protein